MSAFSRLHGPAQPVTIRRLAVVRGNFVAFAVVYAQMSAFVPTPASRALAGFLLLVASDASLAANAHFAFVQADGSLRLRGKVIRLFGVYVPPTGQTCRTFERPPNCNSRAALALDFKIGAKGVRCQHRRPNTDGTLTALCYSDGVDLSAYLLQRGWAVALPDAPFEYLALERIARNRGLGVWGIPVDNGSGRIGAAP